MIRDGVAVKARRPAGHQAGEMTVPALPVTAQADAMAEASIMARDPDDAGWPAEPGAGSRGPG